jgi:predicted RNase H-like HicB family nuclease
MRQYIALIQASPGGGLAARLPDFPESSVAAESLSELRVLLADHLASRIEAMHQAGKAPPLPSSFETLMADPGNRESAAILVGAKGAKAAAPREEVSVAAIHGASNDEWPEADA